jgi:hypothetical protein
MAPRLRTSTIADTVCMGRKGAQTGKGSGGNTRTKERVRVKSLNTQTVLRVKKVWSPRPLQSLPH